MARPKTIGELRRSGYKPVSVKEELRRNLIAKIKSGERLFPGIYGYEETVLPQLENAILAGQDIILLGERGQAKSRLIRSLTNLLDEETPAIAGCEIHDNPYRPLCKRCREMVARQGEDVELAWLPREGRYAEKLATPDTSVADLVGEIDPIKVAEGRYLADEFTLHYGLIPRTNRGIFCLNELPELAERIQVSLFNIMEERDLQIRGYTVRLPLDICIVASANPEDYTNRGRIITPLKDRFGAVIRTHYPRSLDTELQIMEQERKRFEDSYNTVVPPFIKDIVAEITHLARRSPEINQRSGVSVRLSIGNYEALLSNALRRAIRNGEEQVAPRITDLPYIVASSIGKIELETLDERREEKVLEELVKKAVLNVFNRYFKLHQFEPLLHRFEEGLTVEVGEEMKAVEYVRLVEEIEGLREGVRELGMVENAAAVASAVEFILEGLHLQRRLNKEVLAGKTQYKS